MYTYKCIVRRIKDGDTVLVDVDLGFNIWINNLSVRINGIDTPETRTKDPAEKRYGLIAKEELARLLPISSTQLVTTLTNKDKFGRTIGEFYVDGMPISKYLIENHYAIPYQTDDTIAKQMHFQNQLFLDNK